MDADNIISNCLKKWDINSDTPDDRISRFQNIFNDFIKQFDLKEKDIILDLLDNFKYYSHINVNLYLKEIYNKLSSEYKDMSDNNTIYTFIKKDSGIANSSLDYFSEFTNINNINKNIRIEDYTRIINVIKNTNFIKYIIFIDDFSGTGDSFIKYLKKDIDIYKNKHLILIVVTIMKKAVTNINEFAKRHSFKIDFLKKDEMDKIFTEDTINEKESFMKKSKKLEINDDYILGYEETESLVAFYNNTPNNTFGIFWFETDHNKAIFPRIKDKKPSWKKMKKDKQNRKIKNYYSKS